jgi:PEP-CTERM motif
MPRRHCLLALFALAVAATASRADQIGYDYNFLTPLAVTGDPGNLGAVSFATTAGGHLDGHAVVAAATLGALTSAPASAPDHFSGQSYDLTLQLKDDASGKSGTLTFVGKLFGTLWSTNVNVTTSFDTPTNSLVLGNDTYTVKMGPFIFDPNPTVVGSLTATIDVQAGGGATGPSTQVADAPEPSALVLAGLGAAAVVGRWRRGRARRQA